MTEEVRLRDVMEGDLPTFYEHQRDPEAIRMAAFPPRDREAFTAHWNRILSDATVVKKTVLFGGHVAGNIVSFERSGVREIGYWLGREYWGKGVATRALAEFLSHVKARPLHARAAQHNLASIRVLEKCGFTFSGREKGLPGAGGEEVEEIILSLG